MEANVFADRVWSPRAIALMLLLLVKLLLRGLRCPCSSGIMDEAERLAVSNSKAEAISDGHSTDIPQVDFGSAKRFLRVSLVPEAI